MSQLLLLFIGKKHTKQNKNDTTWLSSEEIKTEAKKEGKKAPLLYEY